MKKIMNFRHAVAITVLCVVVAITGCTQGQKSSDVTENMKSSKPSTLQLQVVQTSDSKLTITAGGVGAAHLGSEQKSANKSTKKPQQHVTVLNDANNSVVHTGSLASGIATYPALQDGDYTITLTTTNNDGWVTGIGVVDVQIAQGSMRSAVPENHSRVLSVIFEQVEPGKLSIKASPTTHDMPLEVAWRMTGPEGEMTQESQESKNTVDISADGEYTLEVRAALEKTPDIAMQSNRFTFTVKDGQVVAQ